MEQIGHFSYGGVHGVLQIIENILNINCERKKYDLKWWVSVVGVFILVCFCWIFFRAENLQDVMYILSHITDGIGNVKSYILQGYIDMQFNRQLVVKLLFPLILLLLYDYISLKKDVLKMVSKMPWIYRWGIYYTIVILAIVLGNFGNSQFVYFQF